MEPACRSMRARGRACGGQSPRSVYDGGSPEACCSQSRQATRPPIPTQTGNASMPAARPRTPRPSDRLPSHHLRSRATTTATRAARTCGTGRRTPHRRPPRSAKSAPHVPAVPSTKQIDAPAQICDNTLRPRLAAKRNRLSLEARLTRRSWPPRASGLRQRGVQPEHRLPEREQWLRARPPSAQGANRSGYPARVACIATRRYRPTAISTTGRQPRNSHATGGTGTPPPKSAK